MVNKIAVAGILFQEGNILLGKRSANRKFYPNVWDLIGGHSEQGETPEETLIREFQEELGIIPTKFVYLTMLHDPEPKIHGEYDYYIYKVLDWLGEPRNILQNEHSEIRWFKIEDALNLDLALPKYCKLFEEL